MISVYTIAAVWLAILVGYKVVTALREAYFTPLSKVPGPWHARWTSLRLKYAIITGTRTDYIHSLHAEYGPFVRINPDEVAVADLKATKEIHKIGAGFTKADRQYLNMRTGAPDGPLGLFNMVGKSHAARRKLFSRGFAQNQLREQWEPVVFERVQLAMRRMKEDSAANGKTDILKWLLLMATDVSANVMFGDSFHMLEAGEKSDYVRAIEHSVLAAALMTEVYPIWKVCRYVPLQSFKDIFHTNQILLEQGRQAMMKVKATPHASNIFDQIAAQAEKEDEKLTEIDAISEAGNLILAGTDTTANTSTYMIWAILKNAKAREALEKELDSVEGPLTDAKLEQLPILGACIDETLRLYGAAPASEPRVVPKGGATLGEYFFPEGTVLSTQAWTMHRQPELFSEPYKFDIFRWLDGRVTPVAKQAMAPFGHGATVCVGMHLAKMELRLTAALFFTELNVTCKPHPGVKYSSNDGIGLAANLFIINKCTLSTMSETDKQPSGKGPDQAFTDFYLQQATKEFGDDLAKLQKAPDFKDGSLEVLVEALKQGQSSFDAADRARIGQDVLERISRGE
ncbi:Isotrichodermin C-15 hydroxylase [Sphaceloma murrayae]|uniref:Isotrichodermin C-15 hydroxylase n=1 Tax=Sphaceloma murrayae TaxID=2082308 RepID=A0A2K1R288_9PEZI|nr:Isotrichodermin C-15 hydroxylase [Sphaceloma murrayae]